MSGESSTNALCARCGKNPAGLARPPFGGAVGLDVQRRVCPDCWAEWQRAEVMVINELKLNFMEPSAQEVLLAQMKQFLSLDSATR